MIDRTRSVTIKFSYVIDIKMIVVSETVNKNETPQLPTLVPNDNGTKSPSALHLSYVINVLVVTNIATMILPILRQVVHTNGLSISLVLIIWNLQLLVILVHLYLE
jgi:hypothetical protein